MIRRSLDRLLFIMEIPIPWKTVLYSDGAHLPVYFGRIGYDMAIYGQNDNLIPVPFPTRQSFLNPIGGHQLPLRANLPEGISVKVNTGTTQQTHHCLPRSSGSSSMDSERLAESLYNIYIYTKPELDILLIARIDQTIWIKPFHVNIDSISLYNSRCVTQAI